MRRVRANALCECLLAVFLIGLTRSGYGACDYTETATITIGPQSVVCLGQQLTFTASKACNDPGLVPDSITWSGFSGAWSCNGSMSCATTPSAVGCITPIVQIRGHNGTIGYCADSDGSAVAKVVSATVSAADVWNFNGATPAQYDLVSQLTGDGGCGGSFSWELEQEGQGRVAYVTPFSGGENPTVVYGTLPSGVEQDIGVIVKYDGVAAGVCATLTVRKPESMQRITTPPDPVCGNHPLVPAQAAAGYECEVRYRIRDQLGDILPHDIRWTEVFTSDEETDRAQTPQDPADNWPRGLAVSKNTDPANARDSIGIAQYPLMYPVCFNNRPVFPGEGLEKVDHWTGDWYVGTVAQPQAVRVFLGCKWQRYRAYANHE